MSLCASYGIKNAQKNHKGSLNQFYFDSKSLSMSICALLLSVFTYKLQNSVCVCVCV